MVNLITMTEIGMHQWVKLLVELHCNLEEECQELEESAKLKGQLLHLLKMLKLEKSKLNLKMNKEIRKDYLNKLKISRVKSKNKIFPLSPKPPMCQLTRVDFRQYRELEKLQSTT